MPRPTLATHGWVLGRRPPAEKFQSFTVFSAELGVLTVLHRVSARAGAPAFTPDLFDEIAWELESTDPVRTWFAREARLLQRPADIGRSYDALRHASAFAHLVSRNDVHEESRPQVYALLGTAFTAFASGAAPGVVQFKSLYCFARDEGYPVRQQWMPTLPAELRELAAHLLRTPLARLEPAVDARVRLLQRRLEEYLRGHTDLILEQ